MRGIVSAVLGLAFTFFLFSCAPAPPIEKPGELPEWVNQTGIMGDVIVAVGAAPKMYNPALQRKEAEHQARVEISKILRTKVQGMQESFSEEARDLMTDRGKSEFMSISVSREVTDAILVGVQPDKYYVDPRTGVAYARVVLQKGDAIAGILEHMKKMSEKQALIIEQHKEKAMKRMEKAINDAFQ